MGEARGPKYLATSMSPASPTSPALNFFHTSNQIPDPGVGARFFSCQHGTVSNSRNSVLLDTKVLPLRRNPWFYPMLNYETNPNPIENKSLGQQVNPPPSQLLRGEANDSRKHLFQFDHINLWMTGTIARIHHSPLIVRKRRMRVCPLRAIHGIGGNLHPTQCSRLCLAARASEILG
jgi:hypothetical protein